MQWPLHSEATSAGGLVFPAHLSHKTIQAVYLLSSLPHYCPVSTQVSTLLTLMWHECLHVAP